MPRSPQIRTESALNHVINGPKDVLSVFPPKRESIEISFSSFLGVSRGSLKFHRESAILSGKPGKQISMDYANNSDGQLLHHDKIKEVSCSTRINAFIKGTPK